MVDCLVVYYSAIVMLIYDIGLLIEREETMKLEMSEVNGRLSTEQMGLEMSEVEDSFSLFS